MNAPHPPAVLMATAVRRSNTDGIARCGMSRATLEATGCRHRATTCSIKDGHFDGHGNAPVRSRAHRPMEEVQNFTRSHWMPPSGKYFAR